jgi:hypothetical protein
MGTVNADWSGAGLFTGTLGDANLRVSSGTMTIDDTANITGDGTVTVDNSATMRINAVKADGEIIANSGTVEITHLEGDLSVSFANITGTKHATWDAATDTFSGTLNGASVTVADGVMSISEETLGDHTINGDGSVTAVITGNSSHDYTNLQLSDPSKELILFNTSNSTFTGNFQDSKVKVDGVTLTANANIVKDVLIDNSSGTVQVNNLEGALDIDLKKITGGTVNANWSGTDEFNGDLSSANLTVSSGTMTIGDSAVIASANNFVVNGTMVVDAEDISSKGASGSGTISVKDLNNDLDASFTNIDAATTLNVEWNTDNSTYIGNLDNVDLLTVNSGWMRTTDDILAGKTANGAGNMYIDVNDATLLDISNVNAGTQYLLLSSTIDLSTGTNSTRLSHIDGYRIATQLTVKDSDITGKNAWNDDTSVNSDTLIIKTSSADINLTDVEGDLKTVLDFTTNVTYTGDTSKVDEFILNDKTLTIDADKINTSTQTVTNTGGGTLNVTNLETNADMELDGISGTKTANWSGDATFDGKLGTVALTVSTGTMTVADSAVISNASSLVVDGAMVANASKISGLTMSGTGALTVDNLQNRNNTDFSNIDTNLNVTAKWNSDDSIFSQSLANVDDLQVNGGTMEISDTNLGDTNVTGAGALRIDSADASVDMSHIAAGVDTILNITTTGSYANGDFTDVSGLTSVTFTDGGNTLTQTDNTLDSINIKGGTGDDTFSFNDASLSTSDTIDAGTGTDTLTISDGATLTDVDFTNLSNFATLTLSDNANSVTLGSEASGAGISTVNGGSADDEFTLNFTNLTTIDAVSGNDTAKLTGTVTANDTDFTGASNVSNIDILDLTGLTINGTDTEELIITKAMIQGWSDVDDDITLKLTSGELENIQVTAEDTTAAEGSASTHEVLIDAHTYDFGDGVTLTAEVV